jgi:tetratricopeptide (TPR) repeat protein
VDLEVNLNNAEMEISRALPELRRVFNRTRDELGLCRTLLLEAALHWDHARSAAAEDAWRGAAEYARSLNDRRDLAEILGWLASAALWGPTPAPEGIRRCKDYLDEIGNHPFGKALILLFMAGLQAMQDDVAAAQATLDSAKNLLDILGPTMTGAITQPAALIAMLVGDPVTAERYLRLEYDTLHQMGERQSRYDEATRLIAISQEAAAGEDLSTQAVSQGLSARILADLGRHREAEEIARSAAALAEQSDLLSEHADTLLDLAHVLAAAGRIPEAHAAATRALDLYQRKGNLPGARESLRYLAQYAPA